ncbi:RNA polymerase sigma factor [Parvibium lacunae]|uniref:Sigma-70 family RNA polymerase sigma factor n=1 Tax=Parvibium lacunae TaxID=1888893 RepID=A0A368L161_9BURK|nr:sigma-70 family RNA polymerase sigma factor [Parvibium lacunae]RCS56839.1 sigma-70 family RNA polymerase sigma factor [Parvibium lacunae]
MMTPVDQETTQLTDWVSTIAARSTTASAAEQQLANQAFLAFYQRTSARAHALIRRIVGDDAAEDVLEEAYWQIWRDAARYSASRGSPMAWLLMICRSRALDWLRRQEQFVALDEQHNHQPDTLFSTPPDVIETTQQQTLIQKALQALDSKERQLIACAYFKDMSHSEIAQHCQMPIGSVKTVLHRAVLKLRAELVPVSEEMRPL